MIAQITRIRTAERYPNWSVGTTTFFDPDAAIDEAKWIADSTGQPVSIMIRRYGGAERERWRSVSPENPTVQFKPIPPAPVTAPQSWPPTPPPAQWPVMVKPKDRPKTVPPLGYRQMSDDEMAIVRLVADGKLNKEIAAELGVPLRTIEDRRRRIMAKTKSESIVDLIRFAICLEELGLIGGER